MDFTASFNTTNSVASSNLRSPNVRCHALGTESVNLYTEMASFAPINN